MMKKINVIFVFAAVLVLLGVFAACELDTAERITVTFEDPSGGNPTRKVAVVKGGSLGSSMPTPTRQGPYVFYGWFEGQSQYFKDTPISTNITLTARWADDIATVSFAFTQTNSSGELIVPTSEIPPVTAIKGLPLGPLAFPVTPRAKGWAFDSWQLNSEDFTTETPVPGDITLTAKWVAKIEFTVTFDPGPGGGTPWSIKVYDGDCIDEWGERFPPVLTENTTKPDAFFVAWLDAENREYDGRVPIRKNHVIDLANPTDYEKNDPIKAKWGLPPYVINFQTEASVTSSPGDGYGDVNYTPVVRQAWDSTSENPKWVIVNNTTYEVPYNTNRWRILYRINLNLPADFNVGFYSRYTIRARFYANKQGAATWPNEPEYTEGQFIPNIPAAGVGYNEAGWLRKKDYGVPTDDAVDGKPWKEYSRSEDGWGQISWCSVANWNGQGADAETMLQRYNLDRKGGTINDTWAPLRSTDLPYPPYLLIQTSDAYVGHIEVTEIVFHNGEFKHANYEGEEPPPAGGGE